MQGVTKAVNRALAHRALIGSPHMAASLEVDAADVVRLISQFCRENKLPSTLAALQAETGVTMNTVEDLPALVADITNGRWDAVLRHVAHLTLPHSKAFMLYELVRSACPAPPSRRSWLALLL